MPAQARLKIKVAPQSADNRVQGWHGDRLKLRVTAAPDKGRANAAVIELLAEVLRLPRSALTVVSGQTYREKTIQIDGLDLAEVQIRLSQTLISS